MCEHVGSIVMSVGQVIVIHAIVDVLVAMCPGIVGAAMSVTEDVSIRTSTVRSGSQPVLFGLLPDLTSHRIIEATPSWKEPWSGGGSPGILAGMPCDTSASFRPGCIVAVVTRHRGAPQLCDLDPDDSCRCETQPGDWRLLRPRPGVQGDVGPGASVNQHLEAGSLLQEVHPTDCRRPWQQCFVGTLVHHTVGVDCGHADVSETVAGPYVDYSFSLYELLARFVAFLDRLMGPADQHQETCLPPLLESDYGSEHLLESIHALCGLTHSPREERMSLGEHHWWSICIFDNASDEPEDCYCC